MKLPNTAASFLALALVLTSCVSHRSGIPQDKISRPRPEDWVGLYHNQAESDPMRTLVNALSFPRVGLRPPAADRVRLTVEGTAAIFEALNAGQLVGTVRAEMSSDSKEIVLRERSQSGDIHGVPGKETLTQTTVLFRNSTGDLVLEQRARGGMALFYVIPVGFRGTSTYVFKRVSPPTFP